VPNSSATAFSLSPLHTIWRQLYPFLLALGFFVSSIWQWRLAQADSIRRNPTPERVEAAISLDPLNAYGYTLRAELQQQRGPNSSSAWSTAAQKAPRDPEVWIRSALEAEAQHNPAQAEKLLLHAATLSKTWLPRWSLANFYARHENQQSSLEWALYCAQRSSGDLRPLFQLIESAGIPPSELPPRFLPKNRAVLLAYLQYRSSHPDHSSLESIASQLLELIPEHPPGWPGLDSDPLSFVFNRRFPMLAEERKALLSVLDRLLASRLGRRAVAFLNLLIQAQTLKASPFNPSQLVTNSKFATIPELNPFDWQLFTGADVAIDIDARQSLATVSLSGSQPESLALLSQVLFIPKQKSYRFEARSSCKACPSPSGFQWQFTNFGSTAPILLQPFLTPIAKTSDFSLQQFNLTSTAEDRLWLLTLRYSRPTGVTRQPQSLQISSVELVEEP